MIITFLRRNIGTIVAALGFVLLCIVTFGNIGELMTDLYWISVKENLTSIGFVSLSLTMIQTVIRQGLAEQALQRGLNTERTLSVYEKHRDLIKSATSKMVYLPYFLRVYNRRHTQLRKREFLINNNYSTEKDLLLSKNEKLIKEYEKIRVNLTVSRIKWTTTEIVYNEDGQIMTLQEHRKKRIRNSTIASFVLMIAMSFLTKGLFFSPSSEPFWQKLIKLFVYMISIAIGSILGVVNEYEKGAFGVPNDLEELNEIWDEFILWKVPQWAIKEIEIFEEAPVEIELEVEEAEIELEPQEQEEPQEPQEPQEPENEEVFEDVEQLDGEEFGTDLQGEQEESEIV